MVKGDIFTSFAVIAVTDLLITPDTCFVHAAAALGKKQICIYRETDEFLLWGPLGDNFLKVTAHFSDISAMPAEEIIKAALKALS